MDNKTRTTIALSTSLLALSLLPPAAMADPDGLFQPARCGSNAAIGLTQVDASKNPVIFDKERNGLGEILLTALPAHPSGLERRVGYEVEVKALRNPSQPGGGPWSKTTISFRIPDKSGNQPNPLTSDNLVVNFHFKKTGVVTKTFKELGVTKFTHGWQTFAVTPTSLGFGGNDLLTRMVVYMRSKLFGSVVSADFGDVQIIHTNQGGIEGGFIKTWLGDCDDLDL